MANIWGLSWLVQSTNSTHYDHGSIEGVLKDSPPMIRGGNPERYRRLVKVKGGQPIKNHRQIERRFKLRDQTYGEIVVRRLVSVENNDGLAWQQGSVFGGWKRERGER